MSKSAEIDEVWYEIPDYTPEKIGLHQALQIFEENHEDIKDAAQRNIAHIVLDNPKPEPSGDETLDMVRNDLRKMRIETLTAGYRKTVERIRTIAESKRFHRPGRITDADIERAREYPMDQLYDGELRGREAGRRFGLSPFNNERTPSFCIHPDNRWSCFSSNQHGDAIDYYMRINNVDFISAVKALAR